jgi:hypothetical protein
LKYFNETFFRDSLNELCDESKKMFNLGLCAILINESIKQEMQKLRFNIRDVQFGDISLYKEVS